MPAVLALLIVMFSNEALVSLFGPWISMPGEGRAVDLEVLHQQPGDRAGDGLDLERAVLPSHIGPPARTSVLRWMLVVPAKGCARKSFEIRMPGRSPRRSRGCPRYGCPCRRRSRSSSRARAPAQC